MPTTDDKPDGTVEPGPGPENGAEDVPETGKQPDQQEKKKPMDAAKRKKPRIIAGVVIGIGVVVALVFYLRSLSYESSNDAFIDGDIVPVSARVSSHVSKVYALDNQRVKSGDLLAELDSRDFQARLNSAKAALEAAKAVNQADIINIDLKRVSSTADLDSAQANVSAAEASVQTEEASAAAAESQCDQARAQRDYAAASLAEAESDRDAEAARHQVAETDLKRYRKMGDTISDQDMDHAVSAEKVSAADLKSARRKVMARQANVKAAEAALKTGENNSLQAKARVRAARSQLDQARARLAAAKSAPKQVEQTRSRAEVSSADIHKALAAVVQAKLNLSYTKIYAPCDGYVTKKNIEPGAYVQTGQALMAIVSPNVWVTANFKETQLTHMRPGQPAIVSVDTYPGVEFEGHVESIQHGTGARFSLLPPENATGNYVKVVQRVPVKIVFDDPKQTQKYLLAPGMSVVPEVNIKAKAQPINQQTSPSVKKPNIGSKTDAVDKK